MNNITTINLTTWKRGTKCAVASLGAITIATGIIGLLIVLGHKQLNLLPSNLDQRTFTYCLVQGLPEAAVSIGGMSTLFGLTYLATYSIIKYQLLNAIHNKLPKLEKDHYCIFPVGSKRYLIENIGTYDHPNLTVTDVSDQWCIGAQGKEKELSTMAYLQKDINKCTPLTPHTYLMEPHERVLVTLEGRLWALQQHHHLSDKRKLILTHQYTPIPNHDLEAFQWDDRANRPRYHLYTQEKMLQLTRARKATRTAVPQEIRDKLNKTIQELEKRLRSPLQELEKRLGSPLFTSSWEIFVIKIGEEEFGIAPSQPEFSKKYFSPAQIAKLKDEKYLSLLEPLTFELNMRAAQIDWDLLNEDIGVTYQINDETHLLVNSKAKIDPRRFITFEEYLMIQNEIVQKQKDLHIQSSQINWELMDEDTGIICQIGNVRYYLHNPKKKSIPSKDISFEEYLKIQEREKKHIKLDKIKESIHKFLLPHTHCVLVDPYYLVTHNSILLFQSSVARDNHIQNNNLTPFTEEEHLRIQEIRRVELADIKARINQSLLPDTHCILIDKHYLMTHDSILRFKNSAQRGHYLRSLNLTALTEEAYHDALAEMYIPPYFFPENTTWIAHSLFNRTYAIFLQNGRGRIHLLPKEWRGSTASALTESNKIILANEIARSLLPNYAQLADDEWILIRILGVSYAIYKDAEGQIKCNNNVCRAYTTQNRATGRYKEIISKSDDASFEIKLNFHPRTANPKIRLSQKEYARRYS